MDSAAQGVVTLNEATIQAIAQAVMVELWKQDMASLLADLRKGSDGIASTLRASGAAMDQAAECPNCGQEVPNEFEHVTGWASGGGKLYTCQPATPEPAAFDENTPALVGFNKPEPASRKMPEAIGFAVSTLRAFAKDFLKRDSFYSASDASKATKAADALEREVAPTVKDIRVCVECANQFIPTKDHPLAQPVAVGMTEELKRVLEFASLRARILRDSHQGDSVAFGERMIAAIAAVRQQAAQGRRG